MAMLNGEINDYLSFKASYLAGRVSTTDYNGGVPGYALYMAPDNAYVMNSPALAGVAGPTGFLLDKDFTAQAPTWTTFVTHLDRFTAGFTGKFGDSSWTWDANYEYGLTHHSQVVYNNGSLYRINMALDAVSNPQTGQPECRVTADGFAGAVAANPGGGYAGANPLLANGCLPLNPFGTGPISQATINYAFGNLVELLRYEQNDATLNASGNYFEGVGAGPWSLAVGYEWRQERGDNTDQPGQPAYLADDFTTQYGSSFGGKVTVNEEYLETNIPLLKDRAGAHLLEFDLAGRVSQYANEALYGTDVCATPGANGCPQFAVPGGTTFKHNFPTWKLSGIYEPSDWLRVRASQSRDERAPNFRELYYNQVIGAGGLFGFCGPNGTDPCTWNLLGNPNLKPETSNTTTIGIVLTPKDVLQGFQFSADWFHIKITDAIEQANPTLIELGCFQGIQQYCNQISFNNTAYNGLTGAAAYQQGNYNITEIQPTSYNGAFYEVRGIDFSLNYVRDLGAAGTLTTRLLTTWMEKQIFDSACIPGYCPIYSILGQTGSGNSFLPDYTPDARWRGSLLVTWTKGPVSVTPNMNFVSSGTLDYLGVTPGSPAYNEALNGTLPAPYNTYGLHPMPYNFVPPYFLFGLNATYSFHELNGLQLFLQVNNLFDRQPPFADGGGNFGPANSYGGTNPIFFDTMGRAFRTGFRLSF